MLLWFLLAFGLAGLSAPFLGRNRLTVILLLSAGSVALISPASLVFSSLISLINFFLIRRVAGRRRLLTFGIILNAALVLFFHLYQKLYSEFNWAGIPALVGVTFLALQCIDYFFSVYYARSSPPAKFIRFFSATLYLPKFFSGPVASLPQISNTIGSTVANDRHAFGMNRILFGLFKKLVLAESIALSVHSTLDFHEAYPGLTFFTSTLLYSLQLYFDFSGYTDIAIGASAMWGIELSENFFIPFRKKSWSEFWKSWHASLTQWLWQYVFNPVLIALTRKRLSKYSVISFATVATFAAMAFFNGLSAGYYVSAGLFALFYIVESYAGLRAASWRAITIFVLFSLALIFFRHPEPAAFSSIVTRLFEIKHFIPVNWHAEYFAPLASGGKLDDYFNLSVSLLLVMGTLLFERRLTKAFHKNEINYTLWFAAILILLSWGVFDSGERFIYMQF